MRSQGGGWRTSGGAGGNAGGTGGVTGVRAHAHESSTAVPQSAVIRVALRPIAPDILV